MSKVPPELQDVPGMPTDVLSVFRDWCRDSTTLLGDMGKYFNNNFYNTHSMEGYTNSTSYHELADKIASDYFKLRNWMSTHPKELADDECTRVEVQLQRCPPQLA